MISVFIHSFILNLSNLLILICGNLCDCCAHKLYLVSFHCYMVVNKNRWQFDTFSVTSCSEWRSTSCFLIYRWCRAHFGRNPSSGNDRCVRVLLCFRGNSAYRLSWCRVHTNTHKGSSYNPQLGYLIWKKIGWHEEYLLLLGQEICTLTYFLMMMRSKLVCLLNIKAWCVQRHLFSLLSEGSI